MPSWNNHRPNRTHTSPYGCCPQSSRCFLQSEWRRINAKTVLPRIRCDKLKYIYISISYMIPAAIAISCLPGMHYTHLNRYSRCIETRNHTLNQIHILCIHSLNSWRFERKQCCLWVVCPKTCETHIIYLAPAGCWRRRRQVLERPIQRLWQIYWTLP